ncbi:MAG TPA: hypothetical protein VGH36_13100 [Acetobacteraceae bacterium]
MTRGAPFLLALLLLLGDCTIPGFRLIDQQTFARTPAPTSTDVARADLPPQPLVVIRFGNLDQDYGPALAEAVNDATTRKPDVAFDVLTPVPTSATLEVQDRFTRQGIIDAQDVANALVMYGVSPDQVHMGFRADAGTPPREVLVFAR